MRKFVVFCITVLGIAFAAPSAHATMLTFNNGVDVWLSSSNTADSGNPNLGWGRNSGRNYVSLIKFTDIFGDGADQIPLGSTIESASLNLYVTDNKVGFDRALYQMTVEWNGSTRWYDIGAGILPGTNTELPALALWEGGPNPSPWHWEDFDVMSSLQDWSDGADNNGWGIWGEPSGVSTGLACSFNYTTASLRPYLTVDFTAPVVPEPASVVLLGIGLAGAALRRFRRKK